MTANTYGAKSATWEKEYGRLTGTTVTRERDEADDGTYEVSASRTSSFTYYPSTGATNGLLKTEERAPADAALKHRTTYT